MTSAEELASVLEDTQESLATALARVEALRNREKCLTQENAHLRKKLRESGLGEHLAESPKMSQRGSVRSLESFGSPGSPKGQDIEGAGDEVEHDGFLNEEAQQHPVILYTNGGKAPATVVTTQDSLEFYEQRARINAAEFVGMSAVNGGDKMPSGKSTLLSYFFSKPKLNKGKAKDGREGLSISPPIQEDGVSEVPLCPVSEAHLVKNTGTFDKYLEKHSWHGAVRKGKGGAGAQVRGVGENAEGGPIGLWQVLWKDGGGNGKLRKLVFEAPSSIQSTVRQHIEAWSGASGRNQPDHSIETVHQENDPRGSSSIEETKPIGSEGELVPPKHFIPNGHLPLLDCPSVVLSEDHIKCLTGAVPKRHRQAGWKLVYSTSKDGFSLQTLYRKAAGAAPTILVVRDMSDYIFGAYCSESWKTAPRFFGTGETFVFQLEPHRIYYPWKKESKVRNDFFMYGSVESLGVGGTGHFAIWLDGELLCGNSGLSDTFGSPCLSKENDFKIHNLELWGLE